MADAATLDIERELKTLVVKELHLEGIDPADIESDEPLFVEGLGLDSIDALEIGIILRKVYDIKIEAATDEIRAHFFSIASLARFIRAEREKRQNDAGDI